MADARPLLADTDGRRPPELPATLEQATQAALSLPAKRIRRLTLADGQILLSWMHYHAGELIHRAHDQYGRRYLEKSSRA